MVIDGIPESVTRADCNTLIAELGFDVNSLKSIEIQPNGIYAEVLVRGDGGVVADQYGAAAHRVYIPIRG